MSEHTHVDLGILLKERLCSPSAGPQKGMGGEQGPGPSWPAGLVRSASPRLSEDPILQTEWRLKRTPHVAPALHTHGNVCTHTSHGPTQQGGKSSLR